MELMNVTHLQRFRTLDMCDTLLLSFADHPDHGMRGVEVKRPLASENLVQDRATGKKHASTLEFVDSLGSWRYRSVTRRQNQGVTRRRI